MMSKEIARQKIAELVEQYRSQSGTVEGAEYNEQQVRGDYIDRFFRALGWDLGNEQGFAESFREVIQEFAVDVEDRHLQRVDYAFKLGNNKNPLFYVEAKKPSVKLKDNASAALQIRGYARGKKYVPISILTNFREFAVYDSNVKIRANDKANVGRIRYIPYEKYLEEFDFLWDTFSKTGVQKGGLEKYIETDTLKKGTSEIDRDFLELLEECRLMLATDVCRNNKDISENDLNYVVSQTINRIVFLRFAEDRGLEEYGGLQRCLSGTNYYKNIFQLFIRADQKYNSGLFDFDKDTVSKRTIIGNRVIKKIVEKFYFPTEYNFSAIPIDVLGNAYEMFLGKVIIITPRHTVRIDEKPEIREAGGVYYTPEYVVNYIITRTIERLLVGKTPQKVTKLKIVDPSCGSGSFLIEAYKVILDWHQDYYSKEYAKENRIPKGLKTDTLTPDGKLTVAEKKRILLNNIYGVDIDVNAVEITKLSLLLKCMEGETSASVENTQRLFHTKVLPSIDDNIRVGNSLIDTDYYELPLEEDEQKKIKPFNWQQTFPQVFKQGGFDVVIGNPPYRKLTVNNTTPILLNYYHNHFQTFSGGSSKNLFQLFIEKMIKLKPHYFSFIVPEALLTTSSNGLVRKMLAENYSIQSLVHFDHFVFPECTIGTVVFVGAVGGKNKTTVMLRKKKPQFEDYEIERYIRIDNSENAWEIYLDEQHRKLFNKMDKQSQPLKNIAGLAKGMVVKNRDEILQKKPTAKSLPFILGNCINRYQLTYDRNAVYDKLEIIGGTRDYSKQTATPRLLIRRTGGSLCATYSDKAELVESTLYILTSEKVNLKYLLGLLNSKLLSYYVSKKLLTNTQGFPQILMGQLEQLPIAEAESKTESKIVRHVDCLLQLNSGKDSTQTPHIKKQLETEIAHHENEINQLVYQLYGLTDEEIKIVEGE